MSSRRAEDLGSAGPASPSAGLIGRSAVLIAGLVGVALVGFVDHSVEDAVALSFFYLVPVVFVCWKAGRGEGLVVAVAAALTDPLYNALSPDGFTDWVPVWNFLVRSGTFVSVVWLSTALGRALDRQRELARIDALTGVSNSRWFLEQAELERQRSLRTGVPLTLVYMDLDHFKSVNDDHGHAAGDDLLREVGTALRSHTRTTDLVGRLGGDEFALVLPDTSPEVSLEVVTRIVTTLSAYVSELSLPVTVSVGVVTTLSATETLEELVWMADNLMYSVKRGGRAAIRQTVLAGAPSQGPKVLEGFSAS